MKYYYLNKIAMAVLVALLLFFGTRTLINIIYQEHPPEKPGYEVAGGEDDAHGKKKEGAPADESAAFIVALNKADPAKGEQDVGLCKVCHSFEKGGPTMIGPNLYGIVGHKIAAHEGFNYSPALKDHGGEWTFENLDKWLTNPQAFAAGTSMAFPGIPDLQKRAEVIAYLNKNSDDPLPIPEPKEEPAAAEAADEGTAGTEEAATGQPEIFALLATADAAKGEQAAALCKVCHTFDEGGATMVGPNLHNVVGADIAHHEGFNYSAALKDKGGSWTYEQLDAWLTNPQAFAAGTTMAFPGVPDAKKRADIIAFLMSNTDNPPPVPSAEAAPAEEEAAPAEEPAAAEEEAAPAQEEAAPAEEPAAEEPAAEEPAAEEPTEPAAEEPPAAEEEAAPAQEEAAPAEEPAAEEPAAEEPAAEEPTEPAAEEPAAATPAEEEAPMAAEPEEPSVTHEPAADEVMEKGREEIIVNPPTVSEDAPSEPSKGEPPSANQPQPVVPEESPDSDMEAGSDSSDSGASASDDSLSGQPQPVYPDGPPDGL